MNRQLLAFRPDVPVGEAGELLRSSGAGAAPVIDHERHPVGVVSLRDISSEERTVSQIMTCPAQCVDESDTIEHAAVRVARNDIHQLVVVDGSGAAVGMVSALDLLRAVLGIAPHHPPTFPHWDEATQLSWTDEWPLEAESLRRAPDGPGVFVLLAGGTEESGRTLVAEPCPNVRTRLEDILRRREANLPLAPRAERHEPRFRAASVNDEDTRERVAAMLREEIDHIPPTGAT